MASGIEPLFRVSNRDSEEPFLSFMVGQAWSDHKPPYLVVYATRGFRDLCMAYANVPGLRGSHKELWLSPELFGKRAVMVHASELKLDLFARSLGKESVLPLGISRERTVGDFLSGKPCAREIMQYAGVSSNDLFLDHWKELALSVEEWPRERWGSSEVTSLKVERYPDNPALPFEEVPQRESFTVLKVAQLWCGSPKGSHTTLLNTLKRGVEPGFFDAKLLEFLS